MNELLQVPHTNVNAPTRDHKTALDIAEILPLSAESSDIKECLLRYGAVRAKFLYQPKPSEELTKTVTRMTNEVKKINQGGINNGTMSVAMFFATIAFVSLFAVPSGSDSDRTAMAVMPIVFMIFFVFNSIALFGQK